MPQCGHSFHLACIDIWLRKKTTCPVCRLPLQDPLGRKHAREATFSMAQAVDSPETSINHSRQWLLTHLGHPEVNGNNQGHLHSVPGNQLHTLENQIQSKQIGTALTTCGNVNSYFFEHLLAVSKFLVQTVLYVELQFFVVVQLIAIVLNLL